MNFIERVLIEKAGQINGVRDKWDKWGQDKWGQSKINR